MAKKPDNYPEQIRTAILDESTFITARFSGVQRPQTAPPWQEVTIRPVELKGQRYWQFSYFDGRQDVTRNYAAGEAAAAINELLALPFRSIAVQTTEGDLTVQFSKKGKAIVHHHQAATKRVLPDLSHNRSKQLILPDNQPNAFLQAVGIMTAEGQVKARHRRKFQQLNRFLELIEQSVELAAAAYTPTNPFHVIDFGCGNAYLTFAAYHYFNDLRGLPAHLTGVDVKAELISKHQQTSQQMKWERMEFHDTAIIGYQPKRPPDMVIALHACDTATDEALAQAVRWQSQCIFAAPCCHHHLQAQLSQQETPAPFPPVMRQAILRERLGDILTDTFRALILRIMGYQTDVVEFISTQHTPRNLMIRAHHKHPSGQTEFVLEYQELKAYWQVTPYLETLLGDDFLRFLEAAAGR